MSIIDDNDSSPITFESQLGLRDGTPTDIIYFSGDLALLYFRVTCTTPASTASNGVGNGRNTSPSFSLGGA